MLDPLCFIGNRYLVLIDLKKKKEKKRRKGKSRELVKSVKDMHAQVACPNDENKTKTV